MEPLGVLPTHRAQTELGMWEPEQGLPGAAQRMPGAQGPQNVREWMSLG